jgi:hypothetical protein
MMCHTFSGIRSGAPPFDPVSTVNRLGNVSEASVCVANAGNARDQRRDASLRSLDSH